MRRSTIILLLLVLTAPFSTKSSAAQVGSVRRQSFQAPAELVPGTPIERTLERGQSHYFTIMLEEDQFLQLVVDQHGIDVVVRVFSPQGKRLGEFDTPNGSEGPENVSVTAATSGSYRIEVAPLDQFETTQPGRYEIRVVELRHATEQEILAVKNQDVVQKKALALLLQTAEGFQQIKLAPTRARLRLRAAQVLWAVDEKQAKKLISDGMGDVKEYIDGIEVGDQDYWQTYQLAMGLRRELILAIASHDPEMALVFLRSTRSLVSPNQGQNNNQSNEELQLEMSLAGQVAAADPKRAFKIAEESLKRGYSASLSDALQRIRIADPALAATLATDVTNKLENEKLLANSEAAGLACNLLWLLRPKPKVDTGSTTGQYSQANLISEADYVAFVQKIVAEGLSYSVPATNAYSTERNSAQNILNSLKSFNIDLEKYVPGSATAVEKKTAELNTLSNPNAGLWEQFQTTLNTGTTEAAIEVASHAPTEIRDQLYQQVATKLAGSGDMIAAKQVVSDHIVNPIQRQQALKNLERQSIYNNIAKGKVEEALRRISTIHSATERAQLISQIVHQIGPGKKRATAIVLLEQARNLVGNSGHADGQEAMNALLEIARCFSRYDSDRAFDTLEPLLEQYNELSSAALVLNGFGQRYYQDGELLTQNGNPVGQLTSQFGIALGTLAMANFERAKTAADSVHAPEARLEIYLTIAEQTIQDHQQLSR